MSQLPPEFDEFQSSDYDPQYTADISTHMYVPDHIDVTGTDDSVSPVHLDDRLSDHAAQMTVPDKIIVLGMICSGLARYISVTCIRYILSGIFELENVGYFRYFQNRRFSLFFQHYFIT